MATLDDDLHTAYKEYSDEMRHFSTVRSALTTFLVTVSLAAFSAYFNKSQSHPFLVAAALVFALAAIAVCLEFSRRTSKALLRRRRIWKHFTGEATVTQLEDPDYPGKWQILGKMVWDPTNSILLIGLALIVLAFHYRESLSAILPTLPPDPKPVALVSETLLFDPNEAKLDQKATQTIEHVRDVALAHPDSMVLLWSHSDTTGPGERNKQLSQLRSTAVRERLSKSGGVAPNRIFSSDLANDALPVVTPPKAPEPWNRSVTIEVRLVGVK
jgi:hypothetical protein